MGSNTLQTKSAGDIVAADDPNQFKTAFGENLVPRNSSGVPTNEGGDLGSSSMRWLNAFIKKLAIGASDSGITIEDSSGDFIIKVGEVEALRLAKIGAVAGLTSTPNKDISDSCGQHITSTGDGEDDITNLSVTLTTIGRPVIIGLTPDGTGQCGCSLSENNLAQEAYSGLWRLYEGESEIGCWGQSTNAKEGTTEQTDFSFAPSFHHFYVPNAGTYTWKYTAEATTASTRLTTNNYKMFAMELR